MPLARSSFQKNWEKTNKTFEKVVVNCRQLLKNFETHVQATSLSVLVSVITE
jgi:hypothetical protein